MNQSSGAIVPAVSQEEFTEFLFVLRRSLSSIAEEERAAGQIGRRRALLMAVGWIDKRYPHARHWRDSSGQ